MRLAREMRHFEATWDVQTSTTDVTLPFDNVGRVSVVTAKEDAWTVTADFHFLSLEPIVARDFARPLFVRLFRYLVAFFDYWLSGTAFSIFVKSWRFGLYFLYPFALTCFFFFAVLLASFGALRFADMHVPGLPALIAVLALLPLLATLGNRWSVTHLMDLWSFSLEYLHGRRPEAEALMERYAGIVVETANAQRFDEIILVGHSTGGGLILDIAARSLKADPELAQRAEISLLTLGSTALKFGLHPAATAYRSKVQTLVDETLLGWAEFQCLIDVINFYNTNPVEAMALKQREQTGSSAFPIVRRIHLSKMMSRAAYERIRGRFFRIHYQFILANTREYYYDFFRICFGPLPISSIPDDPTLKLPRQREAAR